MMVMICDGWATAGSADLNVLSIRINRELNIAFSDKAEVERLLDTVFRPDVANSRHIRIAETRTPKADLAEILANQL